MLLEINTEQLILLLMEKVNTMTFTPENGDVKTETYNQEDGIAMGMYNIDSSIYGFARSCTTEQFQNSAYYTCQPKTPF